MVQSAVNRKSIALTVRKLSYVKREGNFITFDMYKGYDIFSENVPYELHLR